MEPISLKYVTINYKAPIVHFTFKSGAQLGFPEMQELVQYAEKLSLKKSYVVLSDAREFVNVTPEGKKYSLDAKNSPLQKGTAVIVKNTAYRLAANFFMGMEKPAYPFSAFTDEQKAIEWLMSLPLDEQICSH